MADQPEKRVSDEARSEVRDDDLRHDDTEYNPQVEPRSAKAWINLLEESETAFEKWNDTCDKLDKLYANLERLASMGRDREFQMFWANCEVLKPAIYAKPPVPVCVPKFKDRRPVYTAASELVERCAVVAFDIAYINELMLQVRDDLALIGRGVAWCRYESGSDDDSYYDHEKVCIDFKHRRDFLHSVSRSWPEVTWVAAASYLTRSEARKRFRKHSGDAYQDAEYKVDKESEEIGGADNRERAKFWEIWHKGLRRVLWVAKGCEKILDEDDPHLDLQGFFPCPKPSYGTLQRGSLVPVPDVLQYKDQLDELNSLTKRIHAISEALLVRGFYPSGTTELSDAIQAAVDHTDPGRVLVPIANWAAFGGTKDVLVWLPIAEIAQTVTSLVALRKEIISDIYQIMGLSDIMRGATDPQETLGAQQLKTQYGSTRIRDKQYELVRLARDLVCITAEIITEKFDEVTMIEMSQTQLPTRKMAETQAQQVMQQVQQQQQAIAMLQQQMQQNPELQQKAEANPEAMQQAMQQAQQTIATGQQTVQRILQQPTTEQVFRFLKNNRIRSFVLDIETDSTIMLDENEEKQRRGEFMQMMATLLPQLASMITAEPQTAEFCGELLKFSVAPFRAGRSLDGAVDELVEQMKQKGSQQRGDDPVTATNKTNLQIEQLKQQRQGERDKAELVLKGQELQQRNAIEQQKIASNERMKMVELQAKQGDQQGKAQEQNLKAMHSREEHQAHMLENSQKMAIERAKANAAAVQNAQRASQQAQAAQDRRSQQMFRQSRPPGGL